MKDTLSIFTAVQHYLDYLAKTLQQLLVFPMPCGGICAEGALLLYRA